MNSDLSGCRRIQHLSIWNSKEETMIVAAITYIHVKKSNGIKSVMKDATSLALEPSRTYS